MTDGRSIPYTHLHMKNKHVLISGAGIAGLTTAYWLKQWGFIPTLVEKHASLRTGGYKIDLRGAALDILKKMGIYSTIVEQRTCIDHAICIDRQGNHVSNMSTDLCGTRLEGIDLEIMRGNLCVIIRNVASEIECLFGDSITQLTEKENGVYVEFEKNKPRTFDLVIGADGLHSTVRRLTFGEEGNFAKEFGVYVSVFSIPNFLALNACEIEYHSLQRFVNLYRDKKDINAKVALAFSHEEPFRSRDPNEQKKLIQKVFVKSGWEMPRILTEMEKSPDFYFDSMAQIHMPSWSKGRIVLVGDAAYSATPMSGQGTSIAIVGAYILAGELAEAQGNHNQAFSIYEKLMRPFIDKNQELAQLSAYIMKKSFYSELVHKIASIIPTNVLYYFKKLALKRTTKAANAITLKEYNDKSC